MYVACILSHLRCCHPKVAAPARRFQAPYPRLRSGGKRGGRRGTLHRTGRCRVGSSRRRAGGAEGAVAVGKSRDFSAQEGWCRSGRGLRKVRTISREGARRGGGGAGKEGEKGAVLIVVHGKCFVSYWPPCSAAHGGVFPGVRVFWLRAVGRGLTLFRRGRARFSVHTCRVFRCCAPCCSKLRAFPRHHNAMVVLGLVAWTMLIPFGEAQRVLFFVFRRHLNGA